MKILLVEDEVRLAEHVSNGLEQAGHVVDTASNGSIALEHASTTAYDLILLDLMLPGQNGFEVLKNLRDFNIRIPVIILSALSNTEHVIRALNDGALDYIRKPFDFDELLARIGVIGRKSMTQQVTKMVVAGLEMDKVKHEVNRNGKKIELTNREFALLELFMSNPDKLISRTQIAEKVWEVDFDMGSNVIEVHIYQLRKKINKGFETELLRTIVGRGYVLDSNPH
ncbi:MULTISPECIES: response regulator transcription factor [Xanthocytophaga]|uniref:Response regulator transcription factor n=2 Tax=Xanthocytophaga TaxID=3078918 RepID=A0AAE3U4E2_9BACT|nr:MULTISPECIES: response regulator transcription factor [Xanthocytophaga]MDJ1479699.1 response regulator transcription factor [Xanthocytophaga flavus]MDJ1501428.1 response regulator transcription factor [Xanthocytophaga agilis]